VQSAELLDAYIVEARQYQLRRQLSGIFPGDLQAHFVFAVLNAQMHEIAGTTRLETRATRVVSRNFQ